MDFLRSGLRPSLRKSTVFYHKVTAILILFQLAIAICVLVFICFFYFFRKHVHRQTRCYSKTGTGRTDFNGYFCLPVCLEAICLFLLLKNSEDLLAKTTCLNRGILFFSRKTMGIYLLHPFVLERLDRIALQFNME